MDKTIYKLLDRLSISTSIRPYVRKHNTTLGFPGKEKGGLVISADFELGWAFRYSKKNNNPIKMAEQSRINFPFFLKLFDQYQIPITWATVGHLMLKSCKKGDHDWMHRIPYFKLDHKWNFCDGDWYDYDPYSDYQENNAWYAPDLVELILNAKVKHEIGCHSFSHIDFSNENCPREVAEDEIKACINAAKPWDIDLKSMVFPGGSYGNIAVLDKYGFSTYRRNLRQKLAFPYKDNFGLIVTHSTQMVGISNKDWDLDYHAWRLKKFILKAIDTGTIVHLWFHPSDNNALKIFKILLPFIDSLREKNILWTGKMDDLNKLI